MSRSTVVRPGAVLALVLTASLMAVASARADGTSDPDDPAALTHAAASDQASPITVSATRGPGGLDIEGRCRTKAARAAVWSVLTDYDGIDDFVSSMRESRVSGHGDGYVLVDQVAVGGMFLFSRRIHTTLRVHEEPPARIRFEDVLGRDFTTYRGEWNLVDLGGSIEIVYRVHARPAFSIPDFVLRGAFRRTVRELLSEVVVEIERRDQRGDRLAVGAADIAVNPDGPGEEADHAAVKR